MGAIAGPVGRRLAALLVGAAMLHVAVAALQPDVRFFGDEKHYAKYAREDAAAGDTSLLPGALRFHHRPELGSRILVPLLPASDDDQVLLRRVAWVNTILLLAAVALVFAQARLVGASDRAALLAAGIVAFLPWLGFHVHSLWPEIVHTFFLAVAVWAALRFLGTPGWSTPLVAGVAAGAALLAKGSIVPLLPVFLLAFAWGPRKPLLRVAAPVAFLAAAGLVVVPQLVANASAGHGIALSANRWWNLELGLTASTDADDPAVYRGGPGWVVKNEINRRYRDAADTPALREVAARERTLAWLEERPLWRVAVAQVGKLAQLVVVPPDLIYERRAVFEQALGKRARWGADPPLWIAGVELPARWAWRLLVPAGLAGLLLAAWRDERARFPALLLLAYLAASCAAPVKIRFLLPMVPFLALGAALLVDRLVPERHGEAV